MYRMLAAIAILVPMLSACGGQEPQQPATDSPAPMESTESTESAEATQSAEATDAAEMSAHGSPMSNFAPLTIGPYQVQPMFEDELEDGHYNIRVTGGEVQAVRVWVGTEDASGVMVVRGEVEHDYYHHHVEVPSPVTDEMRLWIEIEAPDGTTFTGGTPLAPID